MTVGVVCVALLRTIVDYVRSWGFYYPTDVHPEDEKHRAVSSSDESSARGLGHQDARSI